MKYFLNWILLFSLLGLSACQAAGETSPLETVAETPFLEPIDLQEPTREDGMDIPVDSDIIQSSLKRLGAPAVPQRDQEALVEGNTVFAMDLYQQLREEPGNLFYSPYSISLALAMTYAGARGQTEAEMAEVMRYPLSQEALHPAFNALDQVLASRKIDPQAGMGRGFQLNIANALWGQKDYAFRQEYLDTLAMNYGAGLRLVDYIHNTEGARLKINDWVSEQTEEKIQNLIPQGALNAETRLVLANAIYFNAAWARTFNEGMTSDQPFTLLDGSEIAVPLMHQTENFRYASGAGWQAVQLPYEGHQMSMVVLLPESETFADFEAGLDAQQLNAVLEKMSSVKVDLYLPKFTTESAFALSKTLREMGMSDAFSMSANFSGMTGTDDLFISEVLHKAFVDVDEEGTEAAAATAVIMEAKGMAVMEEPVVMRADHPFIFLIRDKTGTILFMGRVLNPGK